VHLLRRWLTRVLHIGCGGAERGQPANGVTDIGASERQPPAAVSRACAISSTSGATANSRISSWGLPMLGLRLLARLPVEHQNSTLFSQATHMSERPANY
jgi:hypothetical protein